MHETCWICAACDAVGGREAARCDRRLDRETSFVILIREDGAYVDGYPLRELVFDPQPEVLFLIPDNGRD